MKKQNIIVLFNIVIIFIVIFIAEYFVYYIHNTQDYAENKIKTFFIKPYIYLPVFDFKNKYERFLNNEGNPLIFPDVLYGKSSEKPILILGCSFAWGIDLDNKDKFSNQLNKLTGRTIYNRAIPGSGLSQALYMLQRGINIENPEYIIYVYMEDHIRRLFTHCSFFGMSNIFYKYDKKGNIKLKNDLDLLYWHSYILRNFHEKVFINRHENASYTEEEENFLADLFILANNEAKAQFPETKFIIFVYNGDILIKSISEKLKNNGIDKIIYLSELSDIDFGDNNYKLEDNYHPNALAWQIITPLFWEKLNQENK